MSVNTPWPEVDHSTRYGMIRRVADKIYMRWMPYYAAKMTVQTVGHINSRKDYMRWHEVIKPHSIPKQPHRVYTEEWKGWNDFLGNENTYNGPDQANRQPWTPYWDACRIVQAHSFASKREYLAGHDALDGNIPRAAMEAYGDEWKGWPAFLGVDTYARVETAQHVVGIVCLCSSNLLSSNVIEVIIAPEGKKQLTDKLGERTDLRVVKAYVWESDLFPRVKQLIASMSSEAEPGKFVVPNVNALLYEIDNILLMYRE